MEEEEQVTMNFNKFEIDKFSGHNNFNIWKIQMMTLLWKEGSVHAINSKYPNDIRFQQEKFEGHAFSVIQLSLAPNLLCEVSKSTEEVTK